MNPPLPEGKLAPGLLARLLSYTSRSSLLSVGAFPGEDAAVAAGAPTIVLTADPITFTDERIGAYTVAVKRFAVLPAPLEQWFEMVEHDRLLYPHVSRDRHGNPIDD